MSGVMGTYGNSEMNTDSDKKYGVSGTVRKKNEMVKGKINEEFCVSV